MNNDDDDIFKIDPETAWLETVTIGGFRVWHIIAFCLGILLSIIIMVCCCIRFRIPRTKQEIEADYQHCIQAETKNILNSLTGLFRVGELTPIVDELNTPCPEFFMIQMFNGLTPPEL
uniref:Transmembrane inner ear expressed protein n=1 Tax=Glossina brevipalpis TaxID=37001 RepID=A0A1A9WME7_9MUSC